jgi:hypothetical protein
VILLLSSLAHAADEPTVGGYAEVRSAYYLGVDGMPFLFVERVRPEVTVPFSARLALSTTVEAALAEGWNFEDQLADLVPSYPAPTYANETFQISEAGDYLSVERLYLDAWLPFADARIGRQAVHWGSAFLVNPTDPFPQILLTAPWRERAGVNAARVTIPIAERHQVQVLAGTDDLLQNVHAAGRATANFWKTDFSLVGAYRGETDDGLVGVDIRGTAGVGFWLEGAMHIGATSDPDPLTEAPENYADLAVGVDYSFPLLDGLVLVAQYYKNGGALSNPVYVGALLERDDDPFAPVFRDSDYGMASVTLVASPSWSGSALYVQNLVDGSAFAVPNLGWTPNGWLEVSATAQIPLSLNGDPGEFYVPDDSLQNVHAPDGATYDFSGLNPNATFTLWARVSL